MEFMFESPMNAYLEEELKYSAVCLLLLLLIIIIIIIIIIINYNNKY